ncbi:hypothetical protein NDU88_001618 [Pleurodeles waltl]|uniref:Uncharacterized protein n=1 Tax=Pleurodeles waltl TaxID=8319 RepID=A0AAV7UTA8_PLEWA|nr:hypothetical protein NDU88_001618 [Pleurodeles waltl]
MAAASERFVKSSARSLSRICKSSIPVVKEPSLGVAHGTLAARPLMQLQNFRLAVRPATGIGDMAGLEDNTARRARRRQTLPRAPARWA